MTSNQIKYFNEFAEDAFIEIDENLQKIKSELLKLEKYIDQKNVNNTIFNNMLIAFHTIKGISGMVGFSEIQNLSHPAEHLIKFLIESKTKITKQIIDCLYDSVKLIESFLVVYKEGKFNLLETYRKELNRLVDLMVQLSTIVLEPKITQEKDESDVIDEKIPEELIKNHKDRFIYSLVFVPSSELYAEGININKIRETLSEFCEIIQSKPLKDKTGSIYFELILATNTELEEHEYLKKAKISIKKLYSPIIYVTEGSKEEKLDSQVSEYQKFSISNVVRIELSKIDELINKLGDLVITRAKLELSIKNFANQIEPEIFKTLMDINSIFDRKIRDMRESIMRTRLVPIGELFERMKFVVQDIVRQSGKSIELELAGKDTEIDKYLVEKMFDPLLHLVRNSVSHGIELQEDRVMHGKNPTGKISIVAFTSGDSVVIEIEDDGKGIDKEIIIQKAIQLGLIKNKEEISSESDLLNIICSPGFSTREEADMSSGRGVGMTLVKNVIEELGGKLHLFTEINKGTKFTISLPLTLAIIDSIIVEVGNQQYAIPQPSIHEIFILEKSNLKITDGFYFTDYRNQILPLILLKEFLNHSSDSDYEERFSVIVVDTTFGKSGLIVDRIKTKQEIVVRNLNDPLLRINGILGATELGDGKPVLILDCWGIINTFLSRSKQNKEVIL